jgi:rhodanese-related sulfurtransferase
MIARNFLGNILNSYTIKKYSGYHNCSTGYRTAMGVMALQMLGYDNFKSFPPTIEGWKAGGELLE